MFFFFFKQKTAYEMRISDLSSDVCSSDLGDRHALDHRMRVVAQDVAILGGPGLGLVGVAEDVLLHAAVLGHEAPLQAGREACAAAAAQDRKSVVEGKSVSGRVELGGRRIIRKNNVNRIV